MPAEITNLADNLPGTFVRVKAWLRKQYIEGTLALIAFAVVLFVLVHYWPGSIRVI